MKPQSPFVGRAEELRFLVGVLADGTGQGLVLAGAPGVGKTRLVREVLALACSGGRAPLWASASVSAATIPFGAVGHLLPEHEELDRLRILSRAGTWLREAAAGIPVLGVDDAHLLDDASAALVGQLASTRSACVVVTIRTGEPAPEPVTALWKDGLCKRIELQPLSRSETAALVEGLLGGAVEGVARERLWQLSRGNALYVRELVDAGVASGALVRRGDVWCWTGQVAAPPRLIELVATRIGAQPENVRKLMDLVAFGEPLGVGMLGRAGVGAATVEEAERAGLVRTERARTDVEVWLGHPLFGEVARSGASHLHRREVCRALAGAAGTGVQDPVRIGVWHLDGDVAVNPTLLVSGAQRALAALDLELGRRLARAAVDAGGGLEAERILATIHILRGDAVEADELLVSLDAQQLPDPLRAELAAARAWNLTFALGQPDDAAVVLASAGAVITQGWELLECQRASLLGYAGHPAAAVSVAARVLERSGPTGCPLDDATVRALMLTCQSSSVLGRFEASIAAGERAVALHRELHGGDWSLIQEEVLGGLAWVYVFAGRLDTAQSLVDAGLARSHAAGWPTGTAMWMVCQGGVALDRGTPRAALRYFREVVALLQSASHPYDGFVTRIVELLRARAAAQLGDVDGATHALTQADRLATPWLGVLDVWGGSSQAWAAVARGEVETGIGLALAAADRARRDGQLPWELIARHQVVRFGAAERVSDRIVELGVQVDGQLTPPYVRHATALAAGDGAALDGVATAFADLGHLLLAAEAAAHAAWVYRAAGRLGRALTSQARARELGARCEGARTPALALLNDPSGLTRRETEIARLAASGLTSRHIAEKLVISVRTVDNSLHQTYAKLGITGRDDLPSIFRAAGAGDPHSASR